MEVGVTQFDPEEVHNYPIKHITSCIKACRRRANKQAYTTAYQALITYCANSDPKKSPSKSLSDFLPYPQEEEGQAVSIGPFEKGLTEMELRSLALAINKHWVNSRVAVAIAVIDPYIAKSMGM